MERVRREVGRLPFLENFNSVFRNEAPRQATLTSSSEVQVDKRQFIEEMLVNEFGRPYEYLPFWEELDRAMEENVLTCLNLKRQQGKNRCWTRLKADATLPRKWPGVCTFLVVDFDFHICSPHVSCDRYPGAFDEAYGLVFTCNSAYSASEARGRVD